MRTILFFILFWLSLYALDTWFYKSIAQNGYLKVSYIAQTPIEAEALIMGTCVAANGVDIDSFRAITGLTGYNLGVDHSIIDEHRGLLHIYLKHARTSPRYIFYILYPESFDTRLNKFHAYSFTNHYTDTLIHQLIYRNDPTYVWYSDKLPFVKYAYYNAFTVPYMFQGSRYVLTNRKIDVWKTGYTIGLNTILGKKIDNTLVAAFGSNYQEEKNVLFRYDTTEIRSFKELVRYAKSKNIEIIAVSSPYWNELDKYSSNVKATYIFMEKVCKELNVPYIRLQDDFIGRDSTYFGGMFKLNQRGAMAYTRLFSETIKNKSWLQ